MNSMVYSIAGAYCYDADARAGLEALSALAINALRDRLRHPVRHGLHFRQRRSRLRDEPGLRLTSKYPGNNIIMAGAKLNLVSRPQTYIFPHTATRRALLVSACT